MLHRIARLLDNLPWSCWTRLSGGASMRDIPHMLSGLTEGRKCRHDRIGGTHGGCWCGKFMDGECTYKWTQADIDAWHARTQEPQP